MRGARAPVVAPTPAELVGERIEVLFDCVFGSGKKKKKGTLWCAGEVLEASTEETKVKVGGREKKIGTGWVLVRYDAHEGEEAEEDWKLVKPSEFGARRQKAGCWCLEQRGRAKVGGGDLEGLSDLESEEEESDGDESETGSLGSGGD